MVPNGQIICGKTLDIINMEEKVVKENTKKLLNKRKLKNITNIRKLLNIKISIKYKNFY